MVRVVENATLGVDPGSTSTRLFLATESGRVIVVDSGEEGDVFRQEKGDHLTSCYPFDNNRKAYIRNKYDNSRIAVSLKPAFLLLCGIDSPGLVSEYPYAEELWERMAGHDRHHKAFRSKLERAVGDYIDFLRIRTAETCKNHGIRVTEIGIALPGQWPYKVFEYIRDIFMTKFVNRAARVQVSSDQIFYHGESQALAHYLFRHHAKDLARNNIGGDKKRQGQVFVLADFGGQNLNLSTYQAEFGRHDGMAFFELQQPDGVQGGSELQDFYIGEHCEQQILESTGHQLSRLEKQHLVQGFQIQKRYIGPNHEIPEFRQLLNYGDSTRTVTLTPEIVGDAFDRAMRAPIRKLTDVLEQWDRSTGCARPQLIVAGGTAKSRALQQKLEQICKGLRLHKPIFEPNIRKEARFPSANVAKGAAYATGNVMTVAEFFSRGAAVGVQMKQGGCDAWDNTAPILCHRWPHNEEGIVSLDVDDGDELQLICDPFLLASSRVDNAHYKRSYNLFTIGVFKRGKVKIKACFFENDKINLDVWWRERLSQEEDWLGLGNTNPTVLPLEFDRSSGCMLVANDRVIDNLPKQAMTNAADTLARDDQHCGIAPLPEMQPGATGFLLMNHESTNLIIGETASANPTLGLPQASGRTEEPWFSQSRFIPMAGNNQDNPLVID